MLAGALVLTACSRGEEVEPESPAEEPGDEPESPAEEPEPEVPSGPPSPITGEPLPEELHERPLMLVKIENTPQARPQTGLDFADFVIEEVVEFGITRFMVGFHSELPEIAGPVRSARPIDVDLASGFGRPILAYSGARAEVQAMLAPIPAVRMVDDAGDPAFFRATSRNAPHNLYIRPERMLESAQARGPEPIADIGWVFDETAPAGEDTCPAGATGCDDPGAAVTINMSSTYITGWQYDAIEGIYRRLQNGQPFVTSEHDQVGIASAREIGAANVVILATRHYIGESGYPETDGKTPAEGARAIVLRDGKRYEARWVKPTATDPISLQTADGQPFPLKPGKTWIQLPSTSDMPAPIG